MKHRLFSLFPFLLITIVGCVHKESVVKYMNPSTLPKPNGYSHVVLVEGGRTLYISGQIALNKDGALVGQGDLRAQTRQVFENLQSALVASGATLDHVVKITVFMTDVSDLQSFRDVRDTFFLKDIQPVASFRFLALFVQIY